MFAFVTFCILTQNTHDEHTKSEMENENGQPETAVN